MKNASIDAVASLEYRGGCPVVPGYDPSEPRIVADPSPWLDAARAEVPAFYVPEWNEWVITRFAELEEVFKDTDNFSTVQGLVFPEPPDEIASQQPDGRWAIESFLERRDPPEHVKLRRLYAPAFSLRQARLKKDWIRSLTDRLVDEFIDLGTADLVEVYDNHIPVAVICNTLGAPEEDARQIYGWTLSVVELFSNTHEGEQLLALGRDVLALERYVTNLVEERRRSPREDDFLTILLQTPFNEDGSTIDDRIAVGLLIDLMFAGSDTAASAIGLIVRKLLEQRELWQGLLDDPCLLESHVEEGLRIANPVRGSWRVTKNKVRVGEVEIPEGAVVRVHTWAASFDEREFPCPHQFDADRDNVRRHITFGRGPNQCPGSFIARTEISIAIETLLDRLPSMRLVPGHEPEFSASLFVPTLLRGIVAEWDERSSPAG